MLGTKVNQNSLFSQPTYGGIKEELGRLQDEWLDEVEEDSLKWFQIFEIFKLSTNYLNIWSGVASRGLGISLVTHGCDSELFVDNDADIVVE